MKLCVITHVRCGESSDYRTLLWAPDDITEEKLEDDVERARSLYLAAEAELAKTYPWHNNSAHHVTIGELQKAATLGQSAADVLMEWNERERIAADRDKARKAARKSFGEHMQMLGYLAFDEHDPDVHVILDWGHRHDTYVEYGKTLLPDLPGIVRRSQGGVLEYTADHPLDPLLRDA